MTLLSYARIPDAPRNPSHPPRDRVRAAREEFARLSVGTSSPSASTRRIWDDGAADGQGADDAGAACGKQWQPDRSVVKLPYGDEAPGVSSVNTRRR
ncbi:hypothetical protein [Streptomyces sp. TRM64462]|uniref:hypothetical protein n=1 Tax=Streptomyces sp. TRM64462 TaxID=2741726 RepID=UPI00158626BB|nr:hypothetical protein [Streptomyces sp. TRM64462]